MQGVFLEILNMSISASWLVLAVLLARLLLKKAPKAIYCVLWALVALRLVCPFSFESELSLVPSVNTVPSQILYDETPQISTGIEIADSAVNGAIDQSLAPNPGDSVNPMQVVTSVASVVWIAGAVIMLAWGAVSYIRLRRKTAAAINIRDNIWICDDIDSPFILGVFKPRIYIPSGTQEEQIAYIEAHERAHIARRDHYWKPLGFVFLAVYWFNPILWVAYILLCRDIELACDEKVIATMSIDEKKAYSGALLDCSVRSRSIAVCPLAFGEVGVKARIKSVLSYKKPAVWIMTAAIILCAVVAVCFLTNPVGSSLDKEAEAYLHQVILEHGRSMHTGDEFACEDHIILKSEKKGDVITVYALVMYSEFSFQNGVIYHESGSHIPSVITLDMSGNGYSSTYWESEDGTRYVPSIREKFPWYLESRAINIHRYSERQFENCVKQAEEHFGTEYYGLQRDPSAETTQSVTVGFVDLFYVVTLNYGTDMPRIVYADGEKFVFASSFGIVVYDTESETVKYKLSFDELRRYIREPDMILIGPASRDGKYVYIAADTGTEIKYTHMLDLEMLEISEYGNELPEDLFECKDMGSYKHMIDSQIQQDYSLSEGVVDFGARFWYLRSIDFNAVNLELVCHNELTGKEEVYGVFNELKTVLPPLEEVTHDNCPNLGAHSRSSLARAWGKPDVHDANGRDCWFIDDTKYVLMVDYNEFDMVYSYSFYSYTSDDKGQIDYMKIPDAAYPLEGEYLTLHEAIESLNYARMLHGTVDDYIEDGQKVYSVYEYDYVDSMAGECTHFGNGTPCNEWKHNRGHSTIFHSNEEDMQTCAPRPAWCVNVRNPNAPHEIETIYIDAQTGDMYSSGRGGGYIHSLYTGLSEYAQCVDEGVHTGDDCDCDPKPEYVPEYDCECGDEAEICAH